MANTNRELAAWAGSVVSQSSGKVQASTDRNTVTVVVGDGERILLPSSPPTQTSVVVRTSAARVLAIEPAQQPEQLTLHRLEILADPSLRGLVLKNIRLDYLSLDLAMINEDVLDFVGPVPEQELEIREGFLGTTDALPPLRGLRVRNAMYGNATTTEKWRVDSLMVDGSFTYSGGPLEVNRVEVRNGSNINAADAPLRLNVIEFMDGREPEPKSLTLRGDVSGTIQFCSDFTEFQLNGATLDIDLRERRDWIVIKGLTFEGSGNINLHRSLEDVRFLSRQGLLSVTLDRELALVSASGELALRAMRGSSCLGSRTSPLILREISCESNVDLINVDIYDLRVPHIAHLERVRRFSPDLRHRREKLSRRERLKDELTKVFTRAPDQEGASKEADFWARMVGIMKQKHGSGASQSDVRYLAALSRIYAPTRFGEKMVLRLYWIAGFGERILRPVLLLMGLSLVAAVVWEASHGSGLGDWQDVSRFLGNIARYAFSPLGFFRTQTLDVPQVSNGFWPQFGTMLVGSLNLAFMVFGLIALTRVAKAE